MSNSLTRAGYSRITKPNVVPEPLAERINSSIASFWHLLLATESGCLSQLRHSRMRIMQTVQRTQKWKVRF